MKVKKVNYDRRKFLKFLAIGGGVGLTAKIFGSDVLNFLSGRTADSVDTKNFAGFNIVQKGNELRIFSKKGEEIFTIDDER